MFHGTRFETRPPRFQDSRAYATQRRITNADLAAAVGLSPSPCLFRVKRLDKSGYIAGYGAHVALGETLTVFTEVTLKDHRSKPLGLSKWRIEGPLPQVLRYGSSTSSAPYSARTGT
jgi:DNA-binding Lrp family transcriptional regulator